MIIPFGWRIVIMAVLAAVCFLSGLGLGIEWESNRRDALELTRIKDVQIKVVEVEKIITKIETKYITKWREREAKKDVIVQEVDKHVATIPDPRECWLDQARVDTINRAVADGMRDDAGTAGAAKPDAGGEAGAMPAADEAAGRQP